MTGLKNCWLPWPGRKTGPAAPAPRDAVLECRTVFLSDLHLGTKDCKADECRKFLKHVRAGKIVLVGDIVDAWALSRGSRWRRRHTRFVRTLLRKMEQEDVEVLYLRGNLMIFWKNSCLFIWAV